MGHFIAEITITASDKVTANFITPKTPVSAGVSGKEVYSMDRASMYKARTSALSVFGVREGLWV